MSDQAALMASLPTTCTPMPMKPDVAAYLAVNVVLTFFMTLAVGGRVYVRVKGPGMAVDDWLTIFAFLMVLLVLGIQATLSACGGGYDVSEVMFNLPLTLRLVFLALLAVILCSAAVKLSVLFFYLRVFCGTKTRRCSWVTIGLVSSWALTFVCATVFSCSPISAQWDLTITDSVCIAQVTMFQGLIYSNAILDLIVMALPVPTVLGLQIKLNEKIALLACFLMGLIAVVACIVRGVYVSGIDMQSNITGTIAPSTFMAELEPILAVTCVSVPTLRPLWRRWRGDSSNVSGAGSGHNFRSELRTIGAGSRAPAVHDDLEMENMSISDDLNDEAGSEKNLTMAPGQGITAETKWTVKYETVGVTDGSRNA